MMEGPDSGRKRKRRGPYRKARKTTDDDIELTMRERAHEMAVTDKETGTIHTQNDETTSIPAPEGAESDNIDMMDAQFSLETNQTCFFTDSCYREKSEEKNMQPLHIFTEEDDIDYSITIEHKADADDQMKAWIDSCTVNIDDLQNDYTVEDVEEDIFYECEESLFDDFDLSEVLSQPYDDDDIDKQELYPGSSVTVGAFMLLLALFASKFNLTGEGIEVLLTLIGMVLPKGHNLCTTIYAFKKYFTHLKNPLEKHYYCAFCCTYISDNTLKKCPNIHCEKDLHVQANMNYFLQVPIIHQVQTLFAQEGFYSQLQEKFKYFDVSGIYRDIYDGKIYRSLFDDEGPLSSPNNISFTFNTDGAPVFKSSKISIWPIFLMINELPYKLRILKDNMLLAGLWFDSKKPAMNTFLKPFLRAMEKMNEGIKCCSPEQGEFICKGYLLAGTADLPARCLLCNSTQYNGAYSCWKCLQPGQTAAVGKGHAHVFPFMKENPKGPPRNDESVMNDAKIASENQIQGKTPKVVNGIKGPSWLMAFPKFKLVNGIAIDYMHGVLLGVQKLLIKLWFDKTHASRNFSFHHSVEEVDKRIQFVFPTLNITRLPRTIQNHLKYWKASEFRSFLLFYGAPVLHGILDKERFNHYLNLVNAMHILLLNGSTENDLMKAENMLFTFCEQFANMYDTKYMTLNIHQLVHLVDSVRDLGPLYSTSCFSFEDKNGFVLKLVRGTQNIDSQIITGISFVQKLPELKQKCIDKGSIVEKVFNTIQNSLGLKRGEKIGKDIYVLGAIQKKKLSPEEFDLVNDYLGFGSLTDIFNCFTRIEFHGNLIYGLDYGRMKKRNNAAVMYESNGTVCFGLIKFFISFSQNDNAAVVQEIQCKKPYDRTCFILSVELKQCTIVPLQDIKQSCMFLQINTSSTCSQCYVCKFPNRLEGD